MRENLNYLEFRTLFSSEIYIRVVSVEKNQGFLAFLCEFGGCVLIKTVKNRPVLNFLILFDEKVSKSHKHHRK